MSEHDSQFGAVEDARLMQKLKSLSMPSAVPGDDSGSFECNICLDSARDPVVTLCGHLYCWPCIYKWLYVHCTSSEDMTCPVCKAIVSPNLLVPLYGNGTSSSESDFKRAPFNAAVPRRPPPSELRTLLTGIPHQTQPINPYGGGYAAMATTNLGGAAIMSFAHPMIGLFGELMVSRISGTTNSNLFTHSNSSPSPYAATANPRMRRQEIELEKSLNRVTIFLLCCIMICLLLF